VQSLVRLQDVPLGFEPGGVLTARVSIPAAKYPDAAARLELQRTLLASLAALPSTRAVGTMTSVPFAPGVRRGVAVHDPALPGRSAEVRVSALEQIVSPGLFRALGVPLLSGREFGAQDQPGSPLVAIVSDRLARAVWGNGQAIGRMLQLDGRSHEVVGVAGDTRGSDGTARGGSLDRPAQPVIYLSSAHVPQGTVTLVMRTDAALPTILPAVRAAIREIEPGLPIPDLRPLDEWIAESTAQARLTTTLAGAFAGVALFLTMVGIYGVISHAVGQRTQEIGVRIAVGAGRRSILGLVLRAGMIRACAGIIVGLLGAWSLSRVVGTLLFEVSATDPLTFALTAVTLTTVAALACVLPALRATRIDPLVALRGD
jgi:predicted permease